MDKIYFHYHLANALANVVLICPGQMMESPFLVEVVLPVCLDPNMAASISTGLCSCKPGFGLKEGEKLCSHTSALGEIFKIKFLTESMFSASCNL